VKSYAAAESVSPVPRTRQWPAHDARDLSRRKKA
jgi:hypothetical protein